MPITLSETAAEEVKRIMEAQELEEGSVLRMGIVGGGCSGLQYSLGFDTGFDSKVDASSQQHGVTLVANKKHALHLDGASIDFKDSPVGRGFAIENPNYPRGGGCPGCGGH